MANYDLKTFVATPVSGDVKLKIYDKFSKLKYSIDPHVAFFYKNAHIVMIKVQDTNDICLDFSSASESNAALVKINSVKQDILELQGGTIPGASKEISVFSKNNLNMVANLTINDGDLACSTPIIDIPAPHSKISVYVNGVDVTVGGKIYPYDCYFSADGISTRIIGDERVGDKLYWNKSISGYNLDTTDLIDFVYLVKITI